MHPFTSETENVVLNEATKKYFIAAIKNLNILICYKSWRKYQMCSVASCYCSLIRLNQQMLILVEFVTIVFFINLTVNLNC